MTSLTVACSIKGPLSLDELQSSAQRAAAAGDYRSAHKLLNQAVDQAKKSDTAFALPHVYEQLGVVYNKEGRYAEAESAFQKALDIYGGFRTESGTDLDIRSNIKENTLRLQLLLAETLTRTGKNSEADKLYKSVIETADTDTHINHAIRSKAVVAYSAFLKTTGNEAGAHALNERLVAETDLPPNQSEDISLAKRALEQGNLPLATKEAGAAVLHTPKGFEKKLSENVIFYCGCLIASGATEEAEKQLEQAESKLRSPYCIAQLRLIRAYLMDLRGRHEEALLLFRNNLRQEDSFNGFGVLVKINTKLKREYESKEINNWLITTINKIEGARPKEAFKQLNKLALTFANYPAERTICLEAAKKLSDNIPVNEQSSPKATYLKMSRAAYAAKDTKKAYELAKQAVSAEVASADGIELQADTYAWAGLTAQSQMQLLEAAEFFKKSVAIEKRPAVLAMDLLSVANEYRWLHDFGAAAPWYAKAVSTARQIPDNGDQLCSFLISSAENLIAQKKYEDAIELFNQADRCTKESKCLPARAVAIQSGLSRASVSLKQYEQAAAAAQKALQFADKTKAAPVMRYRILSQCGTTQKFLKNYDQAIHYYQLAYDEGVKANVKQLSDFAFQIGRCYYDQNKYEQASASMKKALSQSKGDQARTVRNLRWLVICAQKSNDTATAEEYSKQLTQLQKKQTN